MNRQILQKFKITVEMVEKYCRKEGKNINSKKFREEFYRDILDGRIVVENGELKRKRVRTKQE